MSKSSSLFTGPQGTPGVSFLSANHVRTRAVSETLSPISLGKVLELWSPWASVYLVQHGILRVSLGPSDIRTLPSSSRSSVEYTPAHLNHHIPVCHHQSMFSAVLLQHSRAVLPPSILQLSSLAKILLILQQASQKILCWGMWVWQDMFNVHRVPKLWGKQTMKFCDQIT